MSGQRWWRLALMLTTAVTLSACAPERDFFVEEKVREADAIVEQLEGKELEAGLKRILEDKKAEYNKLGFNLLRAALDCGDTSLSVLYNPYTHAFVLTFGNKQALDEEVRALSLNGQKVFVADKPFVGRDSLFGATPGSEVKKALYKVTKQHSEIFEPGKEVELVVVADTMSARKVAAKSFGYRRFVHRGWKVRLRVFDDSETKTIDAHGKRARRAAAMVAYLKELSIEAASFKRFDHPRLAEVSKLLEEREKAAQAEVEATKALPLPKLAKSLSIEHKPACK